MYNMLYKHFVDEGKTFEENLDIIAKYRGASDVNNIKNYCELLALFEKDVVQNFEVTWLDRTNHINKWVKSFASNRIKGNYVSPKVLDPFAARYIGAINNIGIKTFYSCDGWHQKTNNLFKVGFMDRNSMVWHKIITSKAQDGNELLWDYKYPMAVLRLPCNDEDKLKIYDLINKRAEYFEYNNQIFLDMKIDLLDKLKGIPKNMLTDDELENLMRKKL